ncbi:MAG: winged helix-turn-helix domain-containing protein [Pseudomonadota bacterium]
MIDKIGKDAGRVWKFLEKNGDASITKLADGTKLSKNDVHRALGWLAREGKIAIGQKGRTETVSLA